MKAQPIKYQGHQKRINRSGDFWLQVVADYNAGMTAHDIAARYTNPITGKPYSRQHVFWILRKMRKI